MSLCVAVCRYVLLCVAVRLCGCVVREFVRAHARVHACSVITGGVCFCARTLMHVCPHVRQCAFLHIELMYLKRCTTVNGIPRASLLHVRHARRTSSYVHRNKLQFCHTVVALGCAFFGATGFADRRGVSSNIGARYLCNNCGARAAVT